MSTVSVGKNTRIKEILFRFLTESIAIFHQNTVVVLPGTHNVTTAEKQPTRWVIYITESVQRLKNPC